MPLDRILREGGAWIGFVDLSIAFAHFFVWKSAFFPIKVCHFFLVFSIRFSFVEKWDNNLLKIPFTLHFLYSPLSPWLSCYQALRCWHTSIFNYCSSWAAILMILNTSCNVAQVSYLVCACVCFSELTINQLKWKNIITCNVPVDQSPRKHKDLPYLQQHC